MSNSDYHKKIETGAAVAMGLFRLLKRVFRGESKAILQRSERNQMVDPKNFILGGLVGVAAGVITALLFAPKSGKELRKDIIHPFKQNGQHPHPVTKRRSTRKPAAKAGHTLKKAGKSAEKPAAAKKSSRRHSAVEE